MHKQYIDLLGHTVKDLVTGFKGVVTTMSFDLYGCIQAVVTPEAESGKLGECKWFDVSRLKVTSKKKVMDTPDYESGQIAEGKKGPAEKPPMRTLP